MNTVKLLELAAALRTIPKHRVASGDFQMGTWSCGTRACAIGWGARLGVLPEGLSVEFDIVIDCFIPVYKGKTPAAAVATAYDIDVPICEYIFFPESWEAWSRVTPEDVACRIEAVCEPGFTLAELEEF
jgi:hypothetical protein